MLWELGEKGRRESKQVVSEITVRVLTTNDGFGFPEVRLRCQNQA